MLRRPVDKGCRISYQWSPSRKYIHLVLTTFAEFHARKIMHNMVLKWERYLNCPTSVRVAGAIFAVTALIAILAPTWLWTSRGAVRPLPALGAAGSILVGSLSAVVCIFSQLSSLLSYDIPDFITSQWIVLPKERTTPLSCSFCDLSGVVLYIAWVCYHVVRAMSPSKNTCKFFDKSCNKFDKYMSPALTWLHWHSPVTESQPWEFLEEQEHWYAQPIPNL